MISKARLRLSSFRSFGFPVVCLVIGRIGSLYSIEASRDFVKEVNKLTVDMNRDTGVRPKKMVSFPIGYGKVEALFPET
jgi:hypothetical protein